MSPLVEFRSRFFSPGWPLHAIPLSNLAQIPDWRATPSHILSPKLPILKLTRAPGILFSRPRFLHLHSCKNSIPLGYGEMSVLLLLMELVSLWQRWLYGNRLVTTGDKHSVSGSISYTLDNSRETKGVHDKPLFTLQNYPREVKLSPRRGENGRVTAFARNVTSRMRTSWPDTSDCRTLPCPTPLGVIVTDMGFSICGPNDWHKMRHFVI